MASEREEVKRQLLEALQRELEAQEELTELLTRFSGIVGPGTSEAKARLENAQREVSTVRQRLRQIDDRTSEQAASVAHERREFWFRRFHLSLGLAHGAGLAAIMGKIFDSAVSAPAAAGAWWAMFAFALGLVLAGLLPVTLYKERHKWAWVLAGVSAVLFIWALLVLLGAAAVKAHHVWPFW